MTISQPWNRGSALRISGDVIDSPEANFSEHQVSMVMKYRRLDMSHVYHRLALPGYLLNLLGKGYD